MFGERPTVTNRRPRNLEDDFGRAKLKGESNENRRMTMCGKRRDVKFVIKGCTFEERGRSYHINYSFDCDSVGVVYLI